MVCFDRSAYFFKSNEQKKLELYVDIICKMYAGCGSVNVVNAHNIGSDHVTRLVIDGLIDGAKDIELNKKKILDEVVKIQKTISKYDSLLIHYQGSAGARACKHIPDAPKEFWDKIPELKETEKNLANYKEIAECIEYRIRLDNREISLSRKLDLDNFDDLLPLLKHVNKTNKEYQITGVHCFKTEKLIEFRVTFGTREYAMQISTTEIRDSMIIYMFDIDDGFWVYGYGESLIPCFGRAFTAWKQNADNGIIGNIFVNNYED